MSNLKSLAHSLKIPYLEFNKKYISEDGHNELVFDYKRGRVVINHINVLIYNKYSPYDEPLSHMIIDYLEYIFNGTSYLDSTNIGERRMLPIIKYPAIGINGGIEKINNKYFFIATPMIYY